MSGEISSYVTYGVTQIMDICTVYKYVGPVHKHAQYNNVVFVIVHFETVLLL